MDVRHLLLRAFGLLASFAAAAAFSAPQVLLKVDKPGLVRAKSGNEGAPVRFNFDELSRLPFGGEAVLTLPDGSNHVYLHDEWIDHGGGLSTWIARGAVGGPNERAVVTVGPGGAWGSFGTGYGKFRVFPTEFGHDLVTRSPRMNLAPKFPGGDAIRGVDDALELAPLKGTPTLALPSPLKSLTAKVTPSPVLQSDVMVVYSKDLAQKLGPTLLTMVYNLIAATNQAYVDSEVAISLRLVNVTMLDIPNSVGSLDALNGMSGAGSAAMYFQPLTWGPGSVRDAVGADFVALVRDGPDDTGGIASLLSNPSIYPAVGAVQTGAYSVNNYCAGGCEEIFAHELGHNMGSHHDIATIAKDENGAAPYAQGVFPYSYGYYSCATGLTCNPFNPAGCSNYAQCAGNNDNDFGTIMSYVQPRVMRFSNPLLANCEPAGAPGATRACGGASVAPAPASTADNALSLNNVRGSISAYRTQTVTNLPGSLQFTAASYSASDSAGTMTFTVTRVGGSSGTVNVNYATSNGSALAGTDYTAANGTLTWLNGDTANKTFTVTLANDGLTEGNEIFIASLSNPTGATGVHLGYPSQAVGLLAEPFPTGAVGTLPSGYTSPTGSSVPWAISNEAPAGDLGGLSLKSGQLNFTAPACTSDFGNTPCPSIMEYTGSFNAGTIAFAWRTQGLPFYSFFEFLIDGVVVFQSTGAANVAAGDTGWRSFDTPITAGNHTLQWRHRTSLGSICGNFFIDGFSYTGCTDRSWVDQISLPVATPCVEGDADNDGIPNCVEPSEGRNPGAKDNDVFANTRLFSMQQYRDFLNREGDAGGITFWANRITNGTSNRGQVVDYFFTSEEFQNTVAPVVRLYFAYFLRIPDYPGLQFWINYYKAGNSLNTISNFFAGSPEFTATYGALNNSQYVNLIYLNVLGRAPDQGGFDFWLGQLNTNARTRGEVMLAFSESAEYRATSFNMAYVTMMYVGMLRRAPEQGGFDFWVNYLATGNSGLNLINGFLGAAEYRARFLP